MNRKGPEGVSRVSVVGLKLRSPEKAMAVTISGEARKFMVRRLPSLRALKLRLNEVRIAAGLVGCSVALKIPCYPCPF